MLSKVIQIVAEVLGLPVDQINESSGPVTIFEWTSLAHVTMIAALEQEFNVQFEMKEMLGIKKVGDFVGLLEAKLK